MQTVWGKDLRKGEEGDEADVFNTIQIISNLGVHLKCPICERCSMYGHMRLVYTGEEEHQY